MKAHISRTEVATPSRHDDVISNMIGRHQLPLDGNDILPAVASTPIAPAPERVDAVPSDNAGAEPDEALVPVASYVDIITARRQGRAIAESLGFSASDLTIIATAISEVARNIVEYAGSGEVTIVIARERNHRGVTIVVRDAGPGIADVNLVMRDGFSSGSGLGIGLPGARRLMDEFDIVSALGRGTTVTMTKWL